MFHYARYLYYYRSGFFYNFVRMPVSYICGYLYIITIVVFCLFFTCMYVSYIGIYVYRQYCCQVFFSIVVFYFLLSCPDKSVLASVSLSVCLSVCLSCLSLSFSLCGSVSLSLYLSISLSLSLSLSPLSFSLCVSLPPPSLPPPLSPPLPPPLSLSLALFSPSVQVMILCVYIILISGVTG